MGIWGQNQNFLKPGQIIYQNEALVPVINKKCFWSSSEVDRLQIGGIWGHLGSKSKTFQTYTIYVPKRSSCSRDYEKDNFSRSPEVT